jgi:acetyl-CoA carboxylase biotin carboxyl carrier protein
MSEDLTLSEKKTTKRRARPADSTATGSPMDVALLQRLVGLMAANDLNTVDVRDGDRRIILKRGPAVLSMALPATPAVAGPLAPAPGAATPPAPSEASTDLRPIKSPMVGTFYSKPSPDAKPFVAVGSVVDEDTDVCIIEAMKVFNNIKAECRGTIARILVQDGQPVEFGTVLFLVRPS